MGLGRQVAVATLKYRFLGNNVNSNTPNIIVYHYPISVNTFYFSEKFWVDMERTNLTMVGDIINMVLASIINSIIMEEDLEYGVR